MSARGNVTCGVRIVTIITIVITVPDSVKDNCRFVWDSVNSICCQNILMSGIQDTVDYLLQIYKQFVIKLLNGESQFTVITYAVVYCNNICCSTGTAKVRYMI